MHKIMSSSLSKGFCHSDYKSLSLRLMSTRQGELLSYYFSYQKLEYDEKELKIFGKTKQKSKGELNQPRRDPLELFSTISNLKYGPGSLIQNSDLLSLTSRPDWQTFSIRIKYIESLIHSTYGWSHQETKWF